MEFKQLEAFVAVVDYNSFSEAARRLHLTQPTISAHIHTLETELHSKLIIRTTKKLTITARGYQLYDCAIQMLNIRNNLMDEFTGSKKKIIDLAASTIPSSYFLPELLSAFGKQCTNIYFHAWQTNSAGVIRKIVDGSVDLGLIGQKTEEETCCFIPFCTDSLVIATPVNEYYLQLAGKKPVFEDFLNEPFIIRESHSGTRKEMDLFLERHGLSAENLHVVASMNDLESIKRSIINGLGISILSARSVRDMEKTRQILLFPLEESAPVRSFYIVYSKNRILKPHVKQFIRFTKEFYHTEKTLPDARQP